MKNFLSLVLLLTLFCTTLLAQNTNIQYSAGFEEPDEMGWNKILQLESGKTVYFHWIPKNGIGVTIFDNNHKKIADKIINGEVWDASEMKNIKICALFEADGKPVILLQQLLDRVPTLSRIIINPETGGIIEDVVISKLMRLQGGYIFATSWGGVTPPAFFVEKDPATDNYAVINFNSFAKESGGRIEAVYYGVENGKHIEKARSLYDAQGFKYLRFISMAFDDKQRLFVCAYGFNTENSGGADSRVIISRLAKGENSFTHKQIEFSDDFKDTKGLMRMNPGTGMMQLMTLTFLTGKKNYFSGKVSNTYMMIVSYIDPESMYIVTAQPFGGEKSSVYAHEHFKTDKANLGMPMDMMINVDNTTTILHEEMSRILTPKSFSSEMLTVNCTVGNVGISILNDKGMETDGFAINKKQIAIGDIAAFGVSNIHKGYWTYNESTRRINAPYYSFDCVNTTTGNYIVFNEFPENFEKDDTKRRNTMDRATTSSAVCYRYFNGKLDRWYLLAPPNDDDDNRFCYIQSGHYLKSKNTYATIIIDHQGRDKIAKIAWIKF